MSFYPRQYPVLEKTSFTIGADEFQEGVSPVIDAGQAVRWLNFSVNGGQERLRFRIGDTEESCTSNRWSSPVEAGTIPMIGSGQSHVLTAAARFIQIKANEGTTFDSITLASSLVPPAPVNPMDYQVTSNDRPKFLWVRVEGAEDYEVELSQDSSFSGSASRFDRLDESGFVHSSPLSPGIWYWRVRARYPEGTTEWSRMRTFTIDPAFKIKLQDDNHPRLFFAADELPEIRKRVLEDPRIDWQKIKKAADDALEAKLVDEKDILKVEGQHSGFHPLWGQVARGQLEPLSFAYLITEDERYAVKAREVMLHLCSFSRWTGVPFGNPDFFYPVWQAALETAGMCKGIGTAYDWLYNFLSEDDRARIREGILRLGVLPIVASWADPETIRYIPRHQLAAGNWWSVCNSGAGIAALAILGEEPGAERWIEMVSNAIRWYLAYPGGDAWNIDMKAGWGGQCPMWTYPNWGEDGGYIESMGYIDYGLVNGLYFVDALKRTTGLDLSPFINIKLIDQPYHCTRPAAEGGLKSINFNDSGEYNLSSDLYALFVRHTRSSKAQWLLKRSYPKLTTAHAAVAWDPTVEEQAPEEPAKAKLFNDIGWAVFRTGWKTDDTLFAAKFTHGRGHEDVGQFVIYYQGEPMVVDPGVVSYSDPIYYKHLNTSHAHNLVLVDNERQIHTDGRITAYCQAPGIACVEADLTAAYQDRLSLWRRSFIWLEPDTLVLLDTLESDQERDYFWQVHPGGEFEITPGEGALLRSGNKEMLLRMVSPSEWDYEIRDGYIGASPTRYFGIRPKKMTAGQQFAAVFTSKEIDGQLVSIQHQASPEGASVKIETPSATHLVLWRKDQGRLIAEGVDAMARVCAVTLDPAGMVPRRFIIIEGNRLMTGAQTLYECKSSTHTAVDLSYGQLLSY